MKKVLLMLLMTVFLAACGSGGGGEETATTEEPTTLSCGSSHPYMMTAVGSSWTYDYGGTVTITGCEDGIFTSEEVDGIERDVVSLRGGSGLSVEAISGQYFENNQPIFSSVYSPPAKIFFPSSDEVGFTESQTFSVTYTEGANVDTFTVTCTSTVVAKETVTLPVAGTFNNVIKFRQTCSTDGNESDEFFWFAPSIGMIKYAGADGEIYQQLVSYHSGN